MGMKAALTVEMTDSIPTALGGRSKWWLAVGGIASPFSVPRDERYSTFPLFCPYSRSFSLWHSLWEDLGVCVLLFGRCFFFVDFRSELSFRTQKFEQGELNLAL